MPLVLRADEQQMVWSPGGDQTIIERLKASNLSYPQLGAAQQQALEKGREMLA